MRETLSLRKIRVPRFTFHPITRRLHPSVPSTSHTYEIHNTQYELLPFPKETLQ